MSRPPIADARALPLTVRTAAGRVVGYYEFGARDGVPVVALHGTPASGAGFAWLAADALARGVRLVAPDRPGIGYSDRAVQRNAVIVADYPPELNALADALGLDRFSVLGYSGGGPYALAVAHGLAERVDGVAIVSGAGQVGVWASAADFDRSDRQMTRLACRAPLLARVALATSVRFTNVAPGLSLRLAKTEMAAPDRELVARFSTPRAALSMFTQAFLRGSAGVVDDYAALARPWGFAVDAIDRPVHCWHATADITVPLRHSEELVRRVPGAALTRWEGEGHLAVVDHGAEVLDGLLALTAR